MTSTAASWTFEDADPSGQPNPFELPSFSYEKTFYMEAFDVEKWYPLFQDCTFQTQFCHVTLQEARAMVSYYRHHSLGWRGEKDMFSKEVKHLLQALQDRIQQAMDVMQDSPNYFFVRMSCRSPKDAAVDYLNNDVLRLVLAELENKSLSLFEAMSREELVDRLSDAISASSPNTALDALLRAGGKVLRVEHAMDAMKLLLASERVYGDLIHVIEHCVNSKDYNYHWNMKVVVREWESRVDLSNEFRCFVAGSQLTAISQYCEVVYYPQWAHCEETIKKCILDEWDRIKDRITKHYKAAILDFCLIPLPEQKYHVCLIEINPFGPMTGSSCFEWKSDLKLLQCGAESWEQVGTAEVDTVVRLASPADMCLRERAALPFFALIQDEAADNRNKRRG